jgi:hypothetical protein
MTLGPMEYLVIGFQKGKFDGSIAREIGKVVDMGTIRIVDAVMLDRDAEGGSVILEIDAKDDPAFAEFAPLLENRMGLFTQEDLESIVATMPPETSALVLLFEHHWAVNIKDAISAAGGFLIGRAVIPPEVLAELSDELESREKTPA